MTVSVNCLIICTYKYIYPQFKLQSMDWMSLKQGYMCPTFKYFFVNMMLYKDLYFFKN